MTIAASPAAEAPFSIGRVIGRTLEVIGRNFPTFFFVTLIYTLPLLVLNTAGPLLDWNFGEDVSNDVYASIFWFVLFAHFCTVVTVQFCLAEGSLADLAGTRLTFLQCAKAGFGNARLAGSLIGIIIIAYYVVVIGAVEWIMVALQLVPGTLLATSLIVTLPAGVTERRGLLRAGARSIALTRAYWMPIFLMVGVYFLADFAVQGTEGPATGGLSMGFWGVAFFMKSDLTKILGGLMIWTVSGGMTMVTAVGTVSIFQELRDLQPALSAELDEDPHTMKRILEVFD